MSPKNKKWLDDTPGTATQIIKRDNDLFGHERAPLETQPEAHVSLPDNARRAESNVISPIPEPCYEPSVIAELSHFSHRNLDETSVLSETASSGAPRGRVLVMFGCRGGAGATSLTINTAASLVRAGKTVCIVDLDLQLGDVFVALDLEPTTSISALAREAATIDGAALRRRVAQHDSGIMALSQTGNIDDVDDALAECLPALLSKLREQFDYVLIDGVRDFGDYTLAALDIADVIAMVVTQEVAAVRRAARGIQLFRRLGYNERTLRLVVNRHSRKTKISNGDIQTALGMRIHAVVRNDYKRMQAAFNEGALIGDVAKTSGVANDIDILAGTLTGNTPLPTTTNGPALGEGHTAQPKKPGPARKFGRLFRRSKT